MIFKHHYGHDGHFILFVLYKVMPPLPKLVLPFSEQSMSLLLILEGLLYLCTIW